MTWQICSLVTLLFGWNYFIKSIIGVRHDSPPYLWRLAPYKSWIRCKIQYSKKPYYYYKDDENSSFSDDHDVRRNNFLRVWYLHCRHACGIFQTVLLLLGNQVHDQRSYRWVTAASRLAWTQSCGHPTRWSVHLSWNNVVWIH